MRRLAVLACAGAAAGVVLAPTVATAGSGYFVAATNAARAAQGLPAYSVAGDLSALAAQHAAQMAAAHTIFHNPSLSSAVCCWSHIGENVGMGPSDAAVQAALMASPPHRANLMAPYFTQVGIGEARGSDGLVYVDEIFRTPMGAVPAAPVHLPSAAPAAPAGTRSSSSSGSSAGAGAHSDAAVSRGVVRAPLTADVLRAVIDRRVTWLTSHAMPSASDDPLQRGVSYWRTLGRLIR